MMISMEKLLSIFYFSFQKTSAFIVEKSFTKVIVYAIFFTLKWFYLPIQRAFSNNGLHMSSKISFAID